MAAPHPEPEHPVPAAGDPEGLEPAVQWAGDATAAARYSSPAAIRAALVPEQVADFDSACEAALADARRSLRLDQLRHVLRTWRRMALLANQDPGAVRRMLATTDEVQRAGRPRQGSVPWERLRADLGP
ncbi:DUF6247 family protein [Streptoalloteichus hindustanus]|uniref:DUF6247 family protein n=1 Tax=Streptoalloteichus hindustanus TaxID=2017 RepID=UPI0022861587|nr:DUF6247 family protein [Streptoalloteichus hindustanus]